MKADATTDLKDAFLAEYLVPGFGAFEQLIDERAAKQAASGSPFRRLPNGIETGNVQFTYRLDTTKSPPLLRLSFADRTSEVAPLQFNLKGDVVGRGILNMKLHWICVDTGKSWSTEELLLHCLECLQQLCPQVEILEAEIKSPAAPEEAPSPPATKRRVANRKSFSKLWTAE